MKRTPIYLHKNAVALIQVFHSHDSIEDIWITDYLPHEDFDLIAKDAAKQFIDQLENQ